MAAYDRDKALGMIIGLAVGDTLGAAHERDTNVYTGYVRPYKVHTRWSTHIMSTQPTDDTEMTMALLRTLREYGPVKDKIILAYIRWANGMTLHHKSTDPVYTTTTCMGKNTRAIFKGITNLKDNYALITYKNRYDKFASDDIQSNGSLMRCSPYALIPNGAVYAMTDATITNPSIVNQHVNFVYVSVLSMLIRNVDVTKEFLLGITNLTPIVEATIKFAVAGDVVLFKAHVGLSSFYGKKKGWCIIGLFLAIRALFTFDNIMTAYEALILQDDWGGPGSDTDTNCAIVGAMLGAKFGFSNIITDDRMKDGWDKVRWWHLPERLAITPTDQPKHLDFTLHNLEELI